MTETSPRSDKLELDSALGIVLSLAADGVIDDPEYREEEAEQIAAIDMVYDMTGVLSTAPDLLAVARESVEIYEARRDGEPTGHLWPDPNFVVRARAAIALAERAKNSCAVGDVPRPLPWTARQECPKPGGSFALLGAHCPHPSSTRATCWLWLNRTIYKTKRG